MPSRSASSSSRFVAISDGSDFDAMRVASSMVSSTSDFGPALLHREAGGDGVLGRDPVGGEQRHRRPLATHAARQQVAARGFGRHAHVGERREESRASDTNTMSQWASMVKPKPTAAPLTAASSGLGNSCSTSTNAGKPLRDGAVPSTPASTVSAISSRSVPAQNALPGAGEHDDARRRRRSAAARKRVGRRVVELLVERVGAVGPVEREEADAFTGLR